MNAALASPAPTTLPDLPQVQTGLTFTNRFARHFAATEPRFYTALQPTALPEPYWLGYSAQTAALLGLDTQPNADWLHILSGNCLPEGAQPLASVYSGHQFGVWAGQLGDGRALMLGEIKHASQHWELQLKGSGKTPYSRMGDGKAVLRSSIREFLCSEAMAGLGVPTTRCLGVVGSDAPVMRENVETAACVLRVSESFIRFGHFEHFASRNDIDGLKRLADFVIDTYYPACRDAAQPYAALLDEVAFRTAQLMAHWQAVGFMHGVMNTDNMSILGLTIDYGPFGFMDGFNAGHVCNHSDHQGRYAYHMQPQIGHWNVAALAQALHALIVDEDLIKGAIEHYPSVFEDAFTEKLCGKLGLETEHDDDAALLSGTLQLLHQQRVDWTLFWRRLSSFEVDDAAVNAPLRDLFIDRGAFAAWAQRYKQRLGAETRSSQQRKTAMDAVSPKYVLRNHLAEVAIRKARDEKDFAEVARLLQVLTRPYDEQPEFEAYAGLPPDWASSLEVSCSS
jgi:serine/tyrosine/threonine adenylyltransferase